LKNSLSFGSDPEFFLEHSETLWPVCGLVGGTKEEPRDLGNGFGIQEDNVALEMTMPPSYSLEEFQQNMKKALALAQEELPKDFQISTKTSGNFLKKFLKSEQACTFGCAPERNAYTGEEYGIEAEEGSTFRSCGGHVHIGFKEKDLKFKEKFVRILDVLLGLPSLSKDKDVERRKLYGKAGTWRNKSYGLEYRVLSNFWTFDSDLVKWVFEGVTLAYLVISNNMAEEFDSMYNEMSLTVQQIINTGNNEKALVISEKFKDKWQHQFKSLDSQEVVKHIP